jgi:hypothetical protein
MPRVDESNREIRLAEQRLCTMISMRLGGVSVPAVDLLEGVLNPQWRSACLASPDVAAIAAVEFHAREHFDHNSRTLLVFAASSFASSRLVRFGVRPCRAAL